MSARTSGPSPTTIAAVVVALALVVLTGGVVMALAMGDHMSMMSGRGPAGTPQVIATSEVSIDIADFAYAPGNISVARGTKVTWTNRDSAPHTATDDGEAWETGVLSQGQSATIAFDTPGTFNYYCTIHPNMRGIITVRG